MLILPIFSGKIVKSAGVAQLFRARPCQGRGHGLESRHPHHFQITDATCCKACFLFYTTFFAMLTEHVIALGYVIY